MKRLLAMALLPALLACSDDSPSGGGPPGEGGVRLVEVMDGLEAPVHLSAPVGDRRLFVVEQPGRIRIVRDGQLLATPFLDLTAKVGSGGERGLLSVAFHPRYAQNGYLYVNYTDRAGDTRIERYRVSGDADRADAASAQLVISIAQPYPNHNGGQVAFGPDGMLYVGMGDGGSGGDPLGHGQNANTLLGDLLRLDVDRGTPYAIPAGNPFVGQAGKRPEIWATGLRNPWRFSFDRQEGMLYLADVGQSRWEEVNVVPAARAGVNYGWNVMEGAHCYNAASCAQEGLALPVLEYEHPGGCSVTGGFVYRGRAIASIRGHYFYGDFCGGWVRSFRLVNGQATEQRAWEFGDVGRILSFGEDGSGELYLLSSNGRVYRFEAES